MGKTTIGTQNRGKNAKTLFFICKPKNGLISCFYVRYSLFTFRRPKKNRKLSLSVCEKEKRKRKKKREEKNVFVCSTLLGKHVRGSIAVCCSLRLPRRIESLVFGRRGETSDLIFALVSEWINKQCLPATVTAGADGIDWWFGPNHH